MTWSSLGNTMSILSGLRPWSRPVAADAGGLAEIVPNRLGDDEGRRPAPGRGGAAASWLRWRIRGGAAAAEGPERGGLAQACLASWTSMTSLIFSETRTPPFSRLAFQVRPQSLRLSSPVASKAALSLPQGSVATPLNST